MLLFLALILFLLPSYLLRFSVFGVPTTVLEILIYLATLWLLVSQPIARIGERLKPVLRRYGLPIALFIVSAIFATIIAPDKREALGLLKAYILDPILLFLLLTGAGFSRGQLSSLVMALIGSGTLVALATLLGPENAEGRALGLYALDPTASPNFLALFLAPLTILSLTFAMSQVGKSKLLPLLATLLMVAALLDSGSRGGLFAAGFGIGLVAASWLVRQTKGLNRQFAIGLTAGFVLCALIAGWWLAKPNLVEQPSHRAATSNNLRREIWRTTVVDIIPKHWLTGVGLGNFQDHFTTITRHRVNFPQFIAPWARTPHNVFLTLWVNLGLLGLVAFIWLLIVFFRDIYQSRAKGNLSLVLGLSMITLLIHGLVDATYFKNDLAALFWVLLTLGYLHASAGRSRG